MRVPLGQQIEEVRRELVSREVCGKRRVGRRIVFFGRRPASDYGVVRMRAVLATLEWIKRNEAAIRAAMKGSEIA